MTADVSVQVLEAIVDAFNASDLNRIMSFLPTIVYFRCREAPRHSGPDASARTMCGMGLRHGSPDVPNVHYGNAEHFVSGNTGISKWRLTGTTPAGTQVAVCGCDFYTFRNSKVIKKDSHWKIVER